MESAAEIHRQSAPAIHHRSRRANLPLRRTAGLDFLALTFQLTPRHGTHRLAASDRVRLCGFPLLRLHLFHELPHGSHLTRRTLFAPGFKALRGLLHMGQELPVLPLLPSLRDDRFDTLPDPKNSPVVSKNRSSCSNP